MQALNTNYSDGRFDASFLYIQLDLKTVTENDTIMTNNIYESKNKTKKRHTQTHRERESERDMTTTKKIV